MKKELTNKTNSFLSSEASFIFPEIRHRNLNESLEKNSQYLPSFYKTQYIPQNKTSSNFYYSNIPNGNFSLLSNSEIAMKKSFLTINANSEIKHKIEDFKYSKQKLYL